MKPLPECRDTHAIVDIETESAAVAVDLAPGEYRDVMLLVPVVCFRPRWRTRTGLASRVPVSRSVLSLLAWQVCCLGNVSLVKVASLLTSAVFPIDHFNNYCLGT